MRRIWIPGLFVFTILLGLASTPSTAQGSNPPGSYQQTCSDISVQRGTLYARCPDEKGKKHGAKLSGYETCTADIANINGELSCTGWAGGSASQPRGSYTQTCRDIRMRGDTLQAICKSYDGHYAAATLSHPDRCSQGVANINGVLNCAMNDVLPPGSYIATCKDVELRGTTLIASCQNAKDRWINTALRDAQRCTGDIANQNGSLRCAEIKRMEKR